MAAAGAMLTAIFSHAADRSGLKAGRQKRTESGLGRARRDSAKPFGIMVARQAQV